MKKHGYSWIIHGNLKVILFLICRGGLTILSNICNKSFGKIVNGVERDYNVRDHNNGALTLNSHV